MLFFLHRDSSFCFMIHRRNTVYLRLRRGIFSFSYTERYFKSWTHQEGKKSKYFIQKNNERINWHERK